MQFPAIPACTTRGTLTVTNHRFIYSGTTPGAAKSIAYPWPQVTSILVYKNLMTSHVAVAVAVASLDARFMVNCREAEEFAVAAQQQLAQSQQRPPTAPISAAAVPPARCERSRRTAPRPTTPR